MSIFFIIMSKFKTQIEILKWLLQFLSKKIDKYFHMKSKNDKSNYDYNILSNLIPCIWTLIKKNLILSSKSCIMVNKPCPFKLGETPTQL
jgi:hypothetical protein